MEKTITITREEFIMKGASVLGSTTKDSDMPGEALLVMSMIGIKLIKDFADVLFGSDTSDTNTSGDA